MQEFVNSIYEDKTLFYNTSVSERPFSIYLTPGYPPGILTQYYVALIPGRHYFGGSTYMYMFVLKGDSLFFRVQGHSLVYKFFVHAAFK